jgi:hypothetical protein
MFNVFIIGAALLFACLLGGFGSAGGWLSVIALVVAGIGVLGMLYQLFGPGK